MGSGVSADAFKPPTDVPIFRRDNKDRDVISQLIKDELDKCLAQSPPLDEAVITAHMKSFGLGAWAAYTAQAKFQREENIAYNRRLEVDLDHWYEINTANAVLFNDLPLTGIPELLPGRLFTTRMPRNLNQGSAAGDAFMEKIKLNNLNTVMILAETKEYEKYAHADLEAFYKSCGLEILHKPFADYSVPNHEDIVQDVKDLTWRLAEGKNCMVHCAGGSGRTGTIIAAVMKNVGVKDPIAWIRRVKTVYVETEEQEKFVNTIPPVIDPRICMKHPELARAVVAEQIMDALIAKPLRDHLGEDALVLTPDQARAFDYAFMVVDADDTGSIELEELKRMFEGVGMDTTKGTIAKFIETHAGIKITKDEFMKIMTHHVHGFDH